MAIGASFLWMAFVYASFYLVPEQRPLAATHLRAMSGTLLDLIVTALLLLVAAGAGWRICRWLRIPFASPLEQLVLTTGLGLGLQSLLVLGLGLASVLTRWAVALLLGGLALLSVQGLFATVRALVKVRLGRRPPRPLIFYLGATFLLTLALALAPPTDWDGLFYHLTLPRLYIEQGRITPITDMPHQFFPSGIEMLYLAQMLLRSDIAAKLVHYAFMLLLGGIVYLVTEQQISRVFAWTAVTLYAALPMVAVLGGWAYTDLALAFYQMAALYTLLRWSRQPHPKWIVLTGVFCGLALSVKYMAFLCPIYLLLVMLLSPTRGQLLRGQTVRAIGLLIGVSALVAAPWYARNLACTGNPVYPFGYRWVGAAPKMAWDSWRAAWYARPGSGLGWDVWAWLRLPWTLTLGIRDMNFYDGRVGPLLLLALPLLVAWGLRLYGRPGSRPPALRILIGFSLVQYLAWTIGVIASRSLFQSRLLLPACVALCGPVAYIYHELRTLDRPCFSLQRLIGLSVALVLAANLGHQVLHMLEQRPLPVLVGLESRESYLARNLGAHHAAMELLNKRVADTDRVLFLWEPRSYYGRVPSQPDAILDRWPWLVHRHNADLDAIEEELRTLGYTHILYHRAGADLVRHTRLDPLTKADWAALDAFLDRYLIEQAQIGDAYVLYGLW